MNNEDQNKAWSFACGVLGFFIPLVGLILFIIWNKSKPYQAKASGIGALIGFIINILILIIYYRA